jgi:hypothetical protein
MTRKHFNLIASVVSGADLTEKQRGKLANQFADELQKQNSAFNRYLFLKACGVLK